MNRPPRLLADLKEPQIAENPWFFNFVNKAHLAHPDDEVLELLVKDFWQAEPLQIIIGVLRVFDEVHYLFRRLPLSPRLTTAG